MKLSKAALMTAKNAIYEQSPDECVVLINSHNMPDEVIDAWRCGDADAFMRELREVAHDRMWAAFCRDNEIRGWSNENE